MINIKMLIKSCVNKLFFIDPSGPLVNIDFGENEIMRRRVTGIARMLKLRNCLFSAVPHEYVIRYKKESIHTIESKPF